MTEEALFLAALELPDAAARGAYLDAACAGNPALRERLEALLRSHADPDSFLDLPAAARQAGEPPAGDGVTRTLPTEATPPTVAPAPRAASESATEEDPVARLAPAREPGSLGRLDHYEILEVVGRGGMGVVYRARDTKLQRIVAIKVLAPQLAASGTARRRFVREAQAAAAVRDEHVVGIHAVNDDGPVPYLVMEFIAGTTLARRVKQGGPLEVREVLRIGLQAAKGLAAAHAQGLIHRDVTPGNILLENHVQRVKLSDFGLARAVDDASLTQEGQVAGTPLYMSPEQARGEPLDPRSDLFSLGSVLYTMCCGRPAFQATGTLAVMKRVCEETPKPVRQLNPDVPDWLEALIARLLAKDPAARFPSAAELADVLAKRLAPMQHSGYVAPVPAAPRKRRPVALALAAAAALVLAAISVAVWRPWEAADDADPVVAAPPPKDTARPTPRENPPGPKTDKGTDKPAPPVVKDEPGVLTVSQKPESGGKYRTIGEALDDVKPGMTVRVLDDAVYEEFLLVDDADRLRGVTLEATRQATLHYRAGKPGIVWIRNVPGFTLRGFRVESLTGKHYQVGISGKCPGAVLDGLAMTANAETDCIAIYDADPAADAAPVAVKNCIMRGGLRAVLIEGRPHDQPDVALPCGHVIIRDNVMLDCRGGLTVLGAARRVVIAGNRIAGGEFAVNLADLLPGAADVLIVNNTFWRNRAALRLLDDHARGKDFLACRNIRVENNLVLAPQLGVDLVLVNRPRASARDEAQPGDREALLKSPQWRFGHNWREVVAPKAGTELEPYWLPAAAGDHLQASIDVLSREPGHADFLKPAQQSPLATAGAAGVDLPWYVGAVPPEGTAAWNWDWTWDAAIRRLLTVSQKPEAGGRFRTIGEALDVVQPGMTIRVLDDAVYEENLVLSRTKQYRGVTLEAAARATLRGRAGKLEVLRLQNVADFTVRGFRVEGVPGLVVLVAVAGDCHGVVLEGLDLDGASLGAGDNAMVHLACLPKAAGAAPVVVRHCTMRSAIAGVVVEGRAPSGSDLPQACGHILIADNTITGCQQSIILAGLVTRVVVAGNRLMDAKYSAVDLIDLLDGSADVLIANNTTLLCTVSLRIWDDHSRGKEFLKVRNVRFQNNLILEPKLACDLGMADHKRGMLTVDRPGDLEGFLKSPHWKLSHNWREVDAAQAELTGAGRWIPACPEDKLVVPIPVQSRTAGKASFLRPGETSLLAKGGAGGACLPAYVGAVPPEGAAPWDWNRTWEAFVGKLLTVSQKPAAGGRFRTISDALAVVEPGMTIRVLDDAVYEEHLLINRPKQHRGVTLETTGKAALRGPAGSEETVRIQGAAGFTLRGFRLEHVPTVANQIEITGASPGVTLDSLDITGEKICIHIVSLPLASDDAPVVIRSCTLRKARGGVVISGRVAGKVDRPLPVRNVVVQDNTFTGCAQSVFLTGAVSRTLVVGNRITDAQFTAVDLVDLSPTAADILIANNTICDCKLGLRVWDDHSLGKSFLKCKNIRFENNLLLSLGAEGDLVFSDHTLGVVTNARPGDLEGFLKAPGWKLGHNWREIDGEQAETSGGGLWIPLRPGDKLWRPIAVQSREPGAVGYLRPAMDSPLAYGGAGGELPPYVGAVPPEGAEAWDWEKTWKGLGK